MSEKSQKKEVCGRKEGLLFAWTILTIEDETLFTTDEGTYVYRAMIEICADALVGKGQELLSFFLIFVKIHFEIGAKEAKLPCSPEVKIA